MKKGLILSTAIAMALGVGVAVGAHQDAKAARAIEAGDTVYLLPNSNWNQANAWFAMYTFGGSAGEAWTKMNPVEGNESYYSAVVPENSPSVIFTRMNPASDAMNWDNKWNQTGDLTFQADKDLFTVSGWDSGSWGTYVAPEPPEPEDVPEEDGYYIVGTKSSWKFAGATKMDAGDGEDLAKLISYEAEAGEEFRIRGYHDGVASWYVWGQAEEGHGEDNFVVGEKDRVLDIYLNKAHEYYVFDHSEPDVPAEDGYYLVGTKSEWKFEGATKMGAGNEENLAILSEYQASAGEEFKIHGYHDGADTWYIWGQAEEGHGADNYKVGEKDRVLDIYLNNAGEYYVFDHGEPEPEDIPEEEGYYIVGTKSEWKYAGATKLGEGDEENLAKTISYEGTKDEEFRIRGYHDGVDTWYTWGQAEEGHGTDNYEVGGEDRLLDIYLNNAGQYYVFTHADPEPEDIPEEDGYYLVGTKSDWKYAGATKMDAGDGEDLAKLISYEGTAEEEFRIRGYHDGVDTWYAFGLAEEGHEADNYAVGEKDRVLDIFLNFQGKYYVFDHEEPTPDPVYKYSLNGGEAVEMLPHSETEVKSGELHLKKGDVLTFTRDEAAFAVSPKEDSAFTRVYSVEGGLKLAQDYDGEIYLETEGGYLWAGQFDAGYYLFGTFNEWNEKLGTKAVLDGEGPAYVVHGLELAKDDEIEMIHFPESGKELAYLEADKDKTASMTGVDFTVIEEGVEKGNIHVNEAGTFSIYYNPIDGWYSIEDDEYVDPVYTVQVGETVYDLELNAGTEYKIKDHVDIELKAGDEVKVLKDDVAQEFARKKIGNNNLDASYKIIANGQGQVYVDLEAETVFVQGLDFGGYHLLQNNTFVHMTKNDNPMEGFQEYFTGMISFKKDDVVRFVDTTAEEGKGYAEVFDILNINDYSAEGFAVVGEDENARLVAQKDVELSVYLKLKYGADEVYFGAVPEEVVLAEAFAKQFNTAIGAVCKWTNDTDLEALKEAWQAQVTNFNALDVKVQDVLKAATAESDINEIKAFVLKYEYVAGRYGDKLGEGYNFLAKEDLKAPVLYNGLESNIYDNNSMIYIIVAIASVSALALGTLIVIKKRRNG